jgi:hypothetical protein
VRLGIRPMALAAVGIVLGTGAAVSGCGSSGTSPVLLASGTTQGVDWYLWAWEQGGSLCMSTGTAAGPDGGSITPSPDAMTGGQCEYDQKYPDSSYFMSADGGNSPSGDSTAALVFGPLPSDAVRIKVASRLTLTTQPFPAGKALPAGRFWVWAGPYQPPASDGTVLDTPQPLNAQGKPVAFQDF